MTRLYLLPVAALAMLAASVQTPAQTTPKYPDLPTETPAAVAPPPNLADYTRRVVMIPMRDGVKLNTVILVPKSATATAQAPILLTRTPYSAAVLTTNAQSTHLGSRLFGYDNAPGVIVDGGYIRVIQDVRGKYGSEGDYVMNRPFRGPLNSTPVDHSTDTYDTIDWLIKNIPESNGKVGILGISYDGFTTLAALVHPHPALKVAVPMNPMVDGWRGDDWFHNGAFRQQNIPYIYEQTATRSNDAHWLLSNFDDYDMYMRAGSAGELAKQRGMDQVGFWKKLAAHPAYDSFWSDQAVDLILAKQRLTVPTMLVASLWDQEDIYGAIAVYKALQGAANKDNLFLVLGPWHDGQEIEDASSLGAIQFGSDTGLYFRTKILAPFLAHYLKDDAPSVQVTPVTAFVPGANSWERLQAWPSGCEGSCTPTATRLYFGADGQLTYQSPVGRDGYDEYISDPAKPVPYRARP